MVFPSMLRSGVRKVVARVSIGARHPSTHAFAVNVDGEALRVPIWLYYDPG